MKKTLITGVISLLLATGWPTPAVRAQGSLEPPSEALEPGGAPRQHMKTLNQVEPRTLIPGVPYIIDRPGSYYLASNLIYTNEDLQNGITIAADDVRIDFDGFTLTAATNSGSARGIYVDSKPVEPWIFFNVTLRNGVVRGWQDDGINMANADDCQVLDMKVIDNGKYGMLVGPNSLVERCSIRRNGSCGLEMRAGGTILDCKISDNGDAGPFHEGVYADIGSKIAGSTANGNDVGIWVNNFSTIRDCSVLWNDSHGITVGDACRVEDNNCATNGFGSALGAGIYVRGSGNRIVGNNVTANRKGIHVDETEGGGANLIMQNSASDNEQQSYDTSGADFYGEIIDAVDMGTGGFNTSSPWSNFEF